MTSASIQRKTVRFTSYNEYHSPGPSPTHSPLPSPPLPESPPQVESRTSSPLIHRLLKFRDGHNYMKNRSHLDLSEDPSTTLPMSDPVFQQPAIIPHMSSITLVCEALPWEIIIHPKVDTTVTIADILRGVYHNLRRPAVDEEYESEASWRRFEVDKALEFRRRRADEDSGDVRRRVDFLCLQHRFCGLSPTMTPGVWQLHISL